jgi:hypothetical protein
MELLFMAKHSFADHAGGALQRPTSAPATVALIATLSFSAPAFSQPTAALDKTLSDTLVQLAQVGFIGAAIALFLLGALVLIWGRTESENEARNKRLYLLLAFLSLVVAGAVHMWDGRAAGTVVVFFSPDLGAETLPYPTINGAAIQGSREEVDISRDHTLLIAFDRALKTIRDQQVRLRSAESGQRVLAQQTVDADPEAGFGFTKGGVK